MPARRASDKGDSECGRVDRPSPHQLQAEDSPTASQETSRNELAQRLANLPLDTADHKVSVVTRWCQLRDTVQSTALDVFGRARRQHQDWTVQQLSGGKVLGSDAIPAEIYERGGPKLMDHLTALFQMWHQGQVPQEFRDATIVHLYQRKGNHQLCDNHRGISLLNTAGKISLIFSATLIDAYRDESPVIRVAYMTDGEHFNQRRMHFQSRVSANSVHERLFADDCALDAAFEGSMQRSMDLCSVTCDNFGLVINTKKPVVMHQSSSEAAYVAPEINMNGAQLHVVDNFIYLSSTFSLNTKMDGHLRTNCSARTTPAAVSPPDSASSSTPTTNVDPTPETPLPSSSSSIAPTSATAAPVPTTTAHNPGTLTNINPPTKNVSDVKSTQTFPHCDRTFTSHIGLIGHLRTHPTEKGETVPGAATYTRLHCPHCLCTFTHCMRLFGHMCIHENRIDRSLDTPSTSCTSALPSSTHTPPRPSSSSDPPHSVHPPCLAQTHIPSPSASTVNSSAMATISETDTDTANFSSPHRPPTLTSHIGLVGHLRIHRTETGEPVPETLTYTRRIRLNCLHCTRTFANHMRLLGHKRIHENLR
ncbi:hypothetical protein SprV_0401650000 [Sparganum proliferum]